MDDDNQQGVKRCAQCGRILQLGEDVLTVEEGVVGPRGLVPLGDMVFFCSARCLSEHFDDRDRPNLPRRIP
ncbi:hypothetical protein HED60_13980 [Planctomycetales bacterium ZRK34]|nr:hypothetical protein HED60_13980 [Planctomycetales bacterium ZRK34]